MYKQNKLGKTTININASYEGETIEQKIRRIVSNNEAITDGAPLIYTDRKEGVQKAYDIRTDRWEVAVEAMDIVTKSGLAKREERHKTDEQKEADKIAKEAKQNMKKEGEA